MYNFKWLKLSGRLVDVNTYFIVVGDMPTIGVSPVMIDSAILDKMRETSLSNGFGFKGLALGWMLNS